MQCWDDAKELPTWFKALLVIGMAIGIGAALSEPSEADIQREINECLKTGGTPIIRYRRSGGDQVYCRK